MTTAPTDDQIALTSWPDSDAARYREAGLWQGRTYDAFLPELAARHGDRTAVVDAHRRLSYRELDTEAERTAHGLRALGLGRGDRVLLQLPNRAEFVVAWFALQKLGAVPIHTQPGHRGHEITHLARHARARAYIIPDEHSGFDHRELAARVRADSPDLEHVLVVGDPGPHVGFRTFASVAAGQPSDPSPAPGAAAGDIALLLLSGGTTGVPKLIPRTHDDYLYNGRAAGERARLGPDSVYLATLPIAFNYTWNCPGVLGTLTVGGTVVLAPSPDPLTCFELIEREKVTITAINPQLAPVWLEEAHADESDLSSLQVIQIGSARLADDTAAAIVEGLPGTTLQQVFGMAEGLLCLSPLDDDHELRTTAQGSPISAWDEVRVVDTDDRDVPDGQPGELLTRGPYTLRGYYRADEHNTRAFTPDGFYRTGDQVRRLPSGHLVVVGRVKDQINRGGEKIAATEVEGHLVAHPDVRSVALLPAADPDLGERTVAFVVPVDGRVPDRGELARFLAERGLAAYKAPDEVVALDEMPLTPLGKMDKKELGTRV